MEDGRRHQVDIYNLQLRLRFFWQSMKNISFITLVVAFAGFIIGILDFTLDAFTPKNRAGISFSIIGGVLLVIFLYFCITTLRQNRKAKKILMNYLEGVCQQYKRKKQEFNLVERKIVRGSIKIPDENIESGDYDRWEFTEFDALRLLTKQIEKNRHILLQGQMGVGKTMLLLALANRYAKNAKHFLERNHLASIIFPIYIPLRKTEFYNQIFLNEHSFSNHADHLLQTDDYCAWLSNVISLNMNLSKSERKLLYKYIKFTFSKELQITFTLLFDAFDEFPYRQYTGNLAPKTLFGMESKEFKNYWKGPLVISTRPLIMDDLEREIYESYLALVRRRERKFNPYVIFVVHLEFCKLMPFTNSEVETYLLERPIFKQEDDMRWEEFNNRIIKENWNKNFGDDWRIPLFLWALSEDTIDRLPTTRQELYEIVYRHSFNWFFCKKDIHIKEDPNYIWRNYFLDKEKRTIVINSHDNIESSFIFSPASYYVWEKEVHKNLAYYLCMEKKNRFSKKEFESILNKMRQEFNHITTNEHIKFTHILEQVIDDGNYIICPSYDENNLPIYSYSPLKLQEAFTAMKFIELNKTKQINLLKVLLLRIIEMRETLLLCCIMLKEKQRSEKILKEILVRACPDFKHLFQMNIEPQTLLYRIHELELVKKDIRITNADLSRLGLTDIGLLKHLTAIKKLLLFTNRIRDLSPIEKLRELVELELSFNIIEDITPLAKLSQLKKLVSWNNHFKDISPLSNLTKLETLVLKNNFIKELEPLRNLNQLHELDLGRNYIENIEPIGNHLQLEELCLDSNKLTNISHLKKLKKLKYLELEYNQIDDLEPLKNLTRLEVLSLIGNELSNIKVLKNLTSLIILDLEKNRIKDIAPLEGLIQLQDLNLMNNQIEDLSSLLNLITLEKLFLDNNRISDLTPLRNLKEISTLYLNSNHISDLEPLSSMHKIQTLFLENNRISDITPLRNMSQLEELHLEDNEITELDISPIAFLENLTELRVDEEVKLLCDNELLDKATCPLLIEFKEYIKRIY